MRNLFIFITLIICIPLPLQAQNTDISLNRFDRIRDTKVVRVCIWPDYYGITYRNPKTQKLSGIDIDMANELGKDLAVSVQFVDSSFATLIDDVTKDRCDVAMFAIGITPARVEHYCALPKVILASDIYAITCQDQSTYQKVGRHRQPRIDCGSRQRYAS